MRFNVILETLLFMLYGNNNSKHELKSTFLNNIDGVFLLSKNKYLNGNSDMNKLNKLAYNYVLVLRNFNRKDAFEFIINYLNLNILKVVNFKSKQYYI